MALQRVSGPMLGMLTDQAFGQGNFVAIKGCENRTVEVEIIEDGTSNKIHRFVIVNSHLKRSESLCGFEKFKARIKTKHDCITFRDEIHGLVTALFFKIKKGTKQNVYRLHVRSSAGLVFASERIVVATKRRRLTGSALAEAAPLYAAAFGKWGEALRTRITGTHPFTFENYDCTVGSTELIPPRRAGYELRRHSGEVPFFDIDSTDTNDSEIQTDFTGNNDDEVESIFSGLLEPLNVPAFTMDELWENFFQSSPDLERASFAESKRPREESPEVSEQKRRCLEM